MAQTTDDVLAMREVSEAARLIGDEARDLRDWITALHLIGAHGGCRLLRTRDGHHLARDVDGPVARHPRPPRPTGDVLLRHAGQQVSATNASLADPSDQPDRKHEWMLVVADQQLRLAVRRDEWARLAPFAREVVARVGAVIPEPS